MSEEELIQACDDMVTTLTEVMQGKQMIILAAAIGHILGRSTAEPEQILTFLDTVLSNATIYAVCSCGQCEQPTKH